MRALWSALRALIRPGPGHDAEKVTATIQSRIKLWLKIMVYCKSLFGAWAPASLCTASVERSSPLWRSGRAPPTQPRTGASCRDAENRFAPGPSSLGDNFASSL